MRNYSKPLPIRIEARRAIQRWVRQQFDLTDVNVVAVSEMECGLPGCPSIETVIVFWIDDVRHLLKIFKPMLQITLDDFPPSWLRSSLAVDELTNIACC